MNNQDTFISSSDVVLGQSSQSMLNTLVSLTQGMNMHSEILEYKDILTELAQDVSSQNPCQNIDELCLLMENEEVEEIQSISKSVIKGRETLLESLKEHQKTVDRVNILDAQIRSTEKAIKVIKDQIYILEHMHEGFATVAMGDLMTEVEKKKKEILEELQALHGLEVINRDKLEAKIKALASVYNIIRSTPMIHICPVCLTNEVNVYNDPCGHTLCQNCSHHSGMYCHMCRMKVKSIRSIYYS